MTANGRLCSPDGIERAVCGFFDGERFAESTVSIPSRTSESQHTVVQ